MGWLTVDLLLLSACSGVVRGEADIGAPVEAGVPVVEVREGLAVIDEMDIITIESLPAKVGAVGPGHLPDGCTELGEAVVTREGDTFLVELPTDDDAEAKGTMALVPLQIAISLDVPGLPAGTYRADVNGVTNAFTFTIDNVCQRHREHAANIPHPDVGNGGKPGRMLGRVAAICVRVT